VALLFKYVVLLAEPLAVQLFLLANVDPAPSAYKVQTPNIKNGIQRH
jgi:hypothetical protein